VSTKEKKTVGGKPKDLTPLGGKNLADLQRSKVYTKTCQNDPANSQTPEDSPRSETPMRSAPFLLVGHHRSHSITTTLSGAHVEENNYSFHQQVRMMLSTLSKVGASQARRIGLRSLSTQAAYHGTSHHANKNTNHISQSTLLAVASLLGLTASAGITLLEASPEAKTATASEPIPLTQTKDPTKPDFNQPPPRPELPTYTVEEVAEHCDEDSLWCTFRGGVSEARLSEVFATATATTATATTTTLLVANCRSNGSGSAPFARSCSW